MSQQLWVVRAGREAKNADAFVTGNFIAIGFGLVAPDDLTSVSEDALKARGTDGNAKNAVGQLTAFRYRMEIGDFVIVPLLPKRRDYLVGRITGDYLFQVTQSPPGPHRRAAEWLGTFSRDDLSQGAVNTLGAIMTIFRPTAVEAELRSLITRLAPVDPTVAGPPRPMDDTDGPGSGGSGPGTLPEAQPIPTPVTLPALRFDLTTDERGRARIVCDHPALVMEQVPRSVDPSRDWAGVPGVYVLSGTELDTTSIRTGVERTLTTTLIVRPWAYVGLSEDFLGRLSSHRQSKPEWRRALLVRSGGTPFTSDDIKYLELRIHELLSGTDEVLMAQATPRGNLSAQPRNPNLLDACGDTVVAVLRLTGILI